MGDQRGSAPIELVLGIGLLLIPLALLSLSFAPLLQRMVFVRIAAAEAARELVLSDGSEARVLALIREIANNHEVQVAGVSVSYCDGVMGLVDSLPRSDCGSPVKGNLFKVVISTRAPAFFTPYGTVGNVTVRATHTEMVGLYRSTR